MACEKRPATNSSAVSPCSSTERRYGCRIASRPVAAMSASSPRAAASSPPANRPVSREPAETAGLTTNASSGSATGRPGPTNVVGEAVEGRARGQADELGLGHAGVARDRLDDPRQRHRAVVLDVEADLRDAAASRELQADRPDARQALGTALADAPGDRAGLRHAVRARQLEVEGHERGARGDERGAGGRVRLGRAEVRAQLARAQPPCELRGSAAAQLRSGHPTTQAPVEQHGQGELGAEAVAEHERLGAGGAAPRIVQVDHGRDVERPDVRVQPGVAGQVDARQHHARARDERAREHARGCGEREHRTVVVGVGVAVQHARAAGGEGGADRVEHLLVAAFGDVGHREQHAASVRAHPLG